MKRLDPNTYYRPQDEEMRLVGTEGTLSQWRFKGNGPSYTVVSGSGKGNGRILYLGSDVNSFLDARRVETRNN